MRELGCKFGDQTVLQDVSVAVEPGELLLVTGPSGAGKTTLLLHLNGILPPQQGHVRVDGLDMSRGRDRRRVRRLVGLALQSPEHQVFAPTVREDVSIGPRAQNISDVEKLVRWALDAVGATHLIDRDVWRLSAGERRRVALAGVLAMRPRYLILDEPTAGLDARGRRHLLEVISWLRKEGVGVVVASHDPDEFIAMASQVLVLDEGRVATIGPPEDVYYHTQTDFARLGDILLEKGLVEQQPLTASDILEVLR